MKIMERINKLYEKIFKEGIVYNLDKMTISSDIKNENPKIQQALRELEQMAIGYNVEIKDIRNSDRDELKISYIGPSKYSGKLSSDSEYLRLLKTKMVLGSTDINYNNPTPGVKAWLDKNFPPKKKGDESSTARSIKSDPNAIDRVKALREVIKSAKYFSLSRGDDKGLIDGMFELRAKVQNSSGSFSDSFMSIETTYRGEVKMTADFQGIGHGYFSSGITPSEIDKQIKLRESILNEMKEISREGISLYNNITQILKKYPYAR